MPSVDVGFCGLQNFPVAHSVPRRCGCLAGETDTNEVKGTGFDSSMCNFFCSPFENIWSPSLKLRGCKEQRRIYLTKVDGARECADSHYSIRDTRV